MCDVANQPGNRYAKLSTGRLAAKSAGLKPGKPMGLVRYVLERDGWKPDLVEGLFIEVGDDWRVLTDDGVQVLDATDWKLCLS